MKKIFFVVGMLFFVSRGVIFAQTLGTLDEPARLRDIEPVVVQMIYVVWGVGTLALTLILMKIGFDYMTSMGDAQKQQDVRARGSKWLISLLFFFLAYPMILTFYQVAGIGGSSSSCYEDIKTPGFKFFFPTVCTDPQASSDKYDIGADCSGFGQEEFNTIGSSSCCRPSGLILPVNVFIAEKAGGSITTAYKYSNVDGRCNRIDNCSVIPGPNQCTNLNFEYVYDSVNKELITP